MSPDFALDSAINYGESGAPERGLRSASKPAFRPFVPLGDVARIHEWIGGVRVLHFPAMNSRTHGP